MSLLASSTPPDSPTLLPGVTLSDAQATEMEDEIAAMKMTPTVPSSHLAKPITLQDLEHLFLKLFDKRIEGKAEVSDKPKLDHPDDTKSKEAAPASLLAFKKVDEIWDDKAYKYTIVESPKPKGIIDNLDQYVFVVRGRVDKS